MPLSRFYPCNCYSNALLAIPLANTTIMNKVITTITISGFLLIFVSISFNAQSFNVFYLRIFNFFEKQLIRGETYVRLLKFQSFYCTEEIAAYNAVYPYSII